MKEVQISNSRKIVIQKTKWRGNLTLDIRTYIETPSYTGFTRKGINIPISKAKELVNAILTVLGE